MSSTRNIYNEFYTYERPDGYTVILLDRVGNNRIKREEESLEPSSTKFELSDLVYNRNKNKNSDCCQTFWQSKINEFKKRFNVSENIADPDLAAKCALW